MSVFHSLHWRAQLKRAWGKLTRRSHRLLDLDDVRGRETVESMYEAGCADGRGQEDPRQRVPGVRLRRCVPAARSRGQQRWAGIYAARVCGQSLPAISLVQVGDTYYVRDGHHRVSVARLLGEEYIEAHVQVWQLKGEPVAAPAMSTQLLALF